MTSGRLGLVLLLLGGIAGAVGCTVSSDDGSSSADVRAASGSEALKSTLVLDAGCTAALVGPRQLLLAARCVSGNNAFTPGAMLTFNVATNAHGVALAASAPLTDGGDAPIVDASVNDSAADGATSADASTGPNTSTTQATIASVTIHPTFAASCNSGSACDIGSLAAGGVKDMAVVTLTADLTAIPIIPVDLDAVGQGDPLLTVGAGCSRFDGRPGQVHTTPTIAVPAQVEAHFGSPYQGAPTAALTQLSSDYVITPGRGWHNSDPSICKGDIGAPLFRADKLAVAGITAGFTSYDPKNMVPVTLQHTRVDDTSVGTWLETLGVTTIRSCNGACAALAYDGGMPDLVAPDGDDAGLVGDGGFILPDQGTEADLGPNTDPAGYSDSDPTYADGGRKIKGSEQLVCSSAPALGASTTSGFGFAFGLALALGALRRRRTRS